MEIFPKHISRDLYTQKIRPFIGSHIIKVLVGQRRSGKSYILYQLIDEIKKTKAGANIIYVNTELAEFRGIKTGADLYDYVAARLDPRRGNYVFIDEIQEIAGFENGVKSLFAEERCDIYCTGSNAHLLSGELATYLAGRYIQFPVHPLGYTEFLAFYHMKNTDTALRKYLKTGGLPYLASLPADEHFAFEYLRNVYESILLRDVVARENIRNIRFLENLVEYLADNTGSLFSANNISKYLKSQRIQIPVQTVISYLAALEKSFLVRRVPRMDIRGRRIFETGEKYYFEDLGLRNVLVRTGDAGDIAKLIENAVYLFLIQRGYTVYVGKTDAAEIDFVAGREAQRIYVQTAYRISGEETREREIGNLLRIADSFPKYVITMDEDLPRVTAGGIRCVRLKDFLAANV